MRGHHMSFCILEQENVYPELRIYSKKRSDKMPQGANRKKIDFAGDMRSETFAQAYFVYAEDEDFARSVCRREMMDSLLAEPNLKLEVEGTAIVLEDTSKMQADTLRERLERLLRFASLIAKYH